MNSITEERAALLVEGRKLAEDPKLTTEGLERAKEIKTRLEFLKEQESVAKALQGFAPETQEPMRPPMPGLGDGTMPTAEPETKENPYIKAFYAKRFGEPQEMVKAMLTDLHGPNYARKYWAQRRGFFKYIRYGDKAMTAEDWAVGREIIFTPAAIMKAVEDGVDDVSALKTTMIEAADYLGGHVVPVDFQNRIIERLAGLTVVRPRADVLTTSRDAVETPKSTGGDSQYSSAVRWNWVDETPSASAAAENLTFGMERIPVHTGMAHVTLSRNLLEDAAFNLEPYLARKFAECRAIAEDNAFLDGDGAGKPQGILQNATNGLTLTEDTSGAASTITWDGLKAVPYSIDAQYRQNAVWIAEKATYEAISKLKAGDGTYLWKQDQRVGQPRTLEGYPVLEQEAMPTIAANAYAMIFGDLRGYTIADRVGMSVERFLDSATAKTNTVVIVARSRLGGQVTEPWRFVVLKISA